VTARVAILLATLGAVAIQLSTIAAKPTARVLWNASASVPIGLYLIQPAGRLFVSELVAVLPPEPTATFLDSQLYVPRGIPLLKQILALPGQTVCREERSITVDKSAVGDARAYDRSGRPLPVWQGCHLVADGEVFLMNWRSVDSLDGRYFGVLPASAIIGRAAPLWIRREE
jgi:conjugative transfer signal peptidase TraF